MLHPTTERAVLMRTISLTIGVAAALTVGLVVLADAFPVTVIDDRGHAITIESLPRRIVAVGALYAEIAVDLGAIDRLVAVAESADNPVATSNLPTVGPTYAPNVELILGVEPDLVLGATDWGGERPTLEAVGVTVLTTPLLTSVPSILESIRTIGTALGANKESALLIGKIAADVIDAETAVLGRPAVLAMMVPTTVLVDFFEIIDYWSEDMLLIRTSDFANNLAKRAIFKLPRTNAATMSL